MTLMSVFFLFKDHRSKIKMDKELDNKQQNYILVYEVESYRNWFLRDPEPTMHFPTLKYVKYVLLKLKFVAKMLPKNILQIFPSPIEFMTVSFSWSSFGVNSVWLLSLRTPSGMVTITWPQLFKKKLFISLVCFKTITWWQFHHHIEPKLSFH